jgi:DNA helicase-2/ATP-dependent DNA helicase PcrA
MPDPLLLGRSLVVGPGDAVAAAWSSCPRVAVSVIDATTADTLADAWRRRQALVIELPPGLGLDDPDRPPPETVTGRQPWEWPVGLDLVGERLHHALWANAADGRGGPDRPVWRWAATAIGLGARSAPDGAPADVLLPDGTPALCDGGPLDADLAARAGVAVVHRIALEHGSLRPLGGDDQAGIGLAPDQLAAVAEPGAGARVIAPAGSGKTRVLTERARLLIGRWGLPAESIALVAYNVRAANEMRERLADLPGVRIRTLNAMALRLCGRTTTIEETEVRRLLGDLVSLPRRSETDPAAPWIEALSRVRLGLAAPPVVEGELADVSDLDRVARAYRAELATRQVADFDEQVTAAIERLLGDPAFRARSQRFARILLVDEFQDLTPAHLLLIRLLTGPAGAVFGVGDDDQTIYGYAGATPRWLVDFAEWFPGGSSHALEVNYRCPAPVVTAASNLLTRNAVRVAKVIRPGPGAAGDGSLTVLDGSVGPATRTAERVRELVEAGAAPEEVAVLARVNATLVPVQVLLRHHGLPASSGVERRFLQRGGVRAALAWLTVATAPERALPGGALREAARRPKRGMSNSLLDLVAKRHSADDLEPLAGWLEGKGSSREAGKVRDLRADVALVRAGVGSSSTADVLSVVRAKVGEGGLDASAAALDQWSHGAIAAHTDDLDALVELAALEPDPARFPAWLADQLDRSPEPAGQAGQGGRAGEVTLASIHAVKGREWPHVILHHATAGLMPHRLSEDDEEERRVYHVGLTRGRLTVDVVPGRPASPFVAEMAAPGQLPPSPPVSPTSGRRALLGPDSPLRAARGQSRSRERAGGPSELVAATDDLELTWRGHAHVVVAAGAEGAGAKGARVKVIGGSAETTVPYGTTVSVAGRSVVLAHARSAEGWERLRTWRAERSRQLGKPAFVVFDDKTLRAIAAALPTTETGLLAIPGVGPVKLDAYGADLMALADELRSGAGD